MHPSSLVCVPFVRGWQQLVHTHLCAISQPGFLPGGMCPFTCAVRQERCCEDCGRG